MLARSRFYQRRQSPGELFGEFADELKLLAQDCGFSNPVEMVRDRLVCGVYRRELRTRLVSEGAQLSLGRALDIASTFEIETGVGSDSPSHHWLWARHEVEPSIAPEEREEGVLSPTQPDEHPYLKIGILYELSKAKHPREIIENQQRHPVPSSKKSLRRPIEFLTQSVLKIDFEEAPNWGRIEFLKKKFCPEDGPYIK